MSGYEQAIEDFKRARRKAGTEEILARLRGKSASLLRYEEVRQRLLATESHEKYLEEIPLDAIVGSVNRYTDFTRSFLPRKESDQYRWAQVKLALEDMRNFPPILAYKIGDAYFVLDGHHRVSIARDLGAKTIMGYVTPVITKVALQPDDQPDDLILKTERASFLEKTRFDEVRPKDDLTVTVVGQYQKLLEHINVHRYYMGLNRKSPVSMVDAVNHWFEAYYLPIVQVIRERNLLRDFPGRTETDLYIWISEHQTVLKEGLGWDISTQSAVQDFRWRFGRSPALVLSRSFYWLRDWLLPDELEGGPEPGEWRKERLEDHQNSIFRSILITVPGYGYKGWAALNMAISFARREGAWLGGLHVVGKESELRSDRVRELGDAFASRLNEADIPGKMVTEVGKVAQKIWQRSRWTDLVVIKLAYPPPLSFLPRLNSGLRQLIQRCPTPILAVPEGSEKLNHLLLAFDNSPKAREALYLSAYLAGRWKMTLTVVTVEKNDQPDQMEESGRVAREYLENLGINANFLNLCCRPAEAILQTVQNEEVDLIIMGGYSAKPLKELFTGSTVDQVLRKTTIPVLICR
jgi:nucleotide-binding universal stress UspA family protein